MILVFDVGATHTRLALSEKGELGEVVHIDTDPTASGFARFMGTLQEVAKGHKITAVAGAIPCQMEGDDGHITVATNLPDWIGLPVQSRMKGLFECPVDVLNDVEMCGLGEAHYGSGTTKGVMAYFTVSTGVNAVRIVDGRVDASINRFEIGELIIANKDGKPQSLESLTGGAAMAKRLGKKPASVHDQSVWRAEEHDLATGLYDALVSWTPEIVIFGGSMMHDIDLAVVRLQLERFPKVMAEWPRLEYAKLGDLGGLYGALAWLGHTKR